MLIDFARLCKPVSCFPGFAHLASACATHFYLRPHRLDFSFHIYTYKYARTHSSLFIRFGLRARTAIRNIYISNQTQLFAACFLVFNCQKGLFCLFLRVFINKWGLGTPFNLFFSRTAWLSKELRTKECGPTG